MAKTLARITALLLAAAASGATFVAADALATRQYGVAERTQRADTRAHAPQTAVVTKRRPAKA